MAATVTGSKWWQTDWTLTVLLGALALSVFVLHPLESLGLRLPLAAGTVFTIILLAGAARVLHSRVMGPTFAAISLAALAIHWARYAVFGPAWAGVDALGSLAACGTLAGLVLAQAFAEGPITVQRIQGAIAAYLLIALTFAAAYTWIDARIPNAFSGSGLESSLDPMQGFVYFSFVTLTTTGYGDITPAIPVARSLAMFEAVLGQLFPSILLARLVSMELYYRQRRFDREQAILDRQELAQQVARLLREK